jgi:tetratricopeptide (TPR) repeat protein
VERRTRLRFLGGILAAVVLAYLVTLPYRAALRREAEERKREQALTETGGASRPSTAEAAMAEVTRLEAESAEAVPDVSRLVRLSALYTRLGRYPEALRALRQATEADPRSPELRLALADVYETTGYYDRALETLQSLPPEHVDRADVQLRLGRLHTTLGWHQEATPFLRRAIALDPRSAEPHLALALSLASRVNFAEALAELTTAARLAPDDPRLPYETARIQLDAGQLDAARATLASALRRFPGEPSLLLLQGRLRMREGSPEALRAAREAFAQALQTRPGWVEARYQLGLCALAQGDETAATRELSRVARQTPEFEAVALKLGQLYLRRGRKAEGERLLARYEQIMRRGDRQKRLMLRVAMRPDDADAHHALGQFLVHDAGDFRRGITELKRAVTLRPDDPRFAQSLREGLLLSGRKE